MKKLKSDLSNARRERSQLEQKLESEIKKAIQTGRHEVMREIAGGFLPGEKVYLRKEKCEYDKCKHCGGTHKIEIEHNHIIKKTDCPFCDYNGNVEKSKTFFADKDEISSIKVWIVKHDRDFDIKMQSAEVFLKHSDYPSKPDYLYKTEEEAVGIKNI